MPVGLIVLIIIAAALVAMIIIMFVLNKKAQKKRDEQQEQLDAAAQNITMLVIDKKKMKLREAGLPAIVMEQVPKRLRGVKMPIVKAKVGPKIHVFICEREIFDLVPVKKEVKATVSGLYLTNVRGLRTSLDSKPERKGLFGLRRNG